MSTITRIPLLYASSGTMTVGAQRQYWEGYLDSKQNPTFAVLPIEFDKVTALAAGAEEVRAQRR